MVALTSPPSADRPLQPWLARVLRNLVRMRARGAARRVQREQLAAELAVQSADGERLTARIDAERILVDQVLALAEPFRSTVLLRHWHGYSAAEIARLQGVPPGTVRWRLSSGLAQLRRALAIDGGKRNWKRLLAPLLGNWKFTHGEPARVTAPLLAVGLGALGAVAISLVLFAAGRWRADAPVASRQSPPAALGSSWAASVPARELRRDSEPRGPLRLEGQVITADGTAVGGAVVTMDAEPVRTGVSAADGSFVFDAAAPLHRVGAARPVGRRPGRGATVIGESTAAPAHARRGNRGRHRRRSVRWPHCKGRLADLARAVAGGADR